MAFSASLTAALGGVTQRQLAHWRIRTAVAHLWLLDDVDHLSRYRLVGDGRTIVWAEEG